VEDHWADERVQVVMTPIKALGGRRESETTGGRGLADNAAVLVRRQMVHLIDDQQTEAIEASA